MTKTSFHVRTFYIKTVKVKNRDVFISDSRIPANMFCRTRRLDLLYVGKRLNIRTTVLPEVPRLQDRQTGKTADEIQHVDV